MSNGHDQPPSRVAGVHMSERWISEFQVSHLWRITFRGMVAISRNYYKTKREAPSLELCDRRRNGHGRTQLSAG